MTPTQRAALIREAIARGAHEIAIGTIDGIEVVELRPIPTARNHHHRKD